MIRSVLTFLGLFIAAVLPAQDYLDKIAQESCSCANNMKDTIHTDRSYMELGLCMMKAAEPYKKQLKKDHKINFDNIETEGEALGKLIGLRMAGICPDVFLKITQRETTSSAPATAGQELFNGRITKIEKEFFVIFTVNDHAGKSLRFYWLTNAASNIELINKYESLFDKDVKVKYHVASFFDPKINDYRNFNVIDSIEQLSR